MDQNIKFGAGTALDAADRMNRLGPARISHVVDCAGRGMRVSFSRVVIMWVVYFVIAYFLLALLIPLAWSVGRVYMRVRGARNVDCPADRQPALVAADAGFAVKAHLLGDSRLRVQSCSRWPGSRNCGQECLLQLRGSA